MMTFVKPNYRYSRLSRAHTTKAWIKIVELEGKNIPSDIPLTEKSISHWKENKLEVIGYVNFCGLSVTDIISIVSATKRGEAMISINRFGQVAIYKIKKIAM
jgi:hypothetical protein